MKPLEVWTCQRAENLKKKSSKIQKNNYAATMVSAARRQIIGGGGAPINKSRRRRPQIVGGVAAGARLYSALLASRISRILQDVPPTSRVFRHSYQVLLCSSGPCYYIIHPVNPRSSFSPSSRNRALYDLLFQA